jgi:hypothetical protein
MGLVKQFAMPRLGAMVDPYEREGYFGRTADGDQGEVYRIEW